MPTYAVFFQNEYYAGTWTTEDEAWEFIASEGLDLVGTAEVRSVVVE